MNILNGKRTIPNSKSETCAELYERLNEGYGMTLRNFQERFNARSETRFGMRRIATREEVAAMEALYPKKEKGKIEAGNQPAAKELPVGAFKEEKKRAAKKPIDWHTTSVRALFGLGVIAHAALIIWECSYLWGEGGFIASSVVALVILGAVLWMAKKPDGETAQNLLYLVWLLDLCAWFVHKAALYHSGHRAYGAGINEYGTGCLALVICVCAGALMYFYRETGIKTDKK